VSRFLFGQYVESDLREIRDYIAQESPESARRLMVRFVEAFRLLAKRPELGRKSKRSRRDPEGRGYL